MKGNILIRLKSVHVQSLRDRPSTVKELEGSHLINLLSHLPSRSDTTYHASSQSQSREPFQSITQKQAFFMLSLCPDKQKAQAEQWGLLPSAKQRFYSEGPRADWALCPAEQGILHNAPRGLGGASGQAAHAPRLWRSRLLSVYKHKTRQHHHSYSGNWANGGPACGM